MSSSSSELLIFYHEQIACAEDRSACSKDYAYKVGSLPPET